MADDGLLFKQVAQVHPRFRTPSVSIVVTGLLGVVWVLLLNFEQLADQFVVAIFPFYALAAAAVFVLRRRQPDRPRPVRVWGYPVVPLLFVVATFLILGNALREHPVGTGLAFGGILLGVPVYLAAFGSRRAGKGAGL
jgi:basic amino acid/polyamine antiporter, APA family